MKWKKWKWHWRKAREWKNGSSTVRFLWFIDYLYFVSPSYNLQFSESITFFHLRWQRLGNKQVGHVERKVRETFRWIFADARNIFSLFTSTLNKMNHCCLQFFQYAHNKKSVHKEIMAERHVCREKEKLNNKIVNLKSCVLSSNSILL